MVIKKNRGTGDWFYGCPNYWVTKCRGSAPYERGRTGSRSRSRTFKRDEFVHVRHRGFGKVVIVENDEVEVEFFNTPGDSGRETDFFPIKKVGRRTPPVGQRCFFREDDGWNVGRINVIVDSEVKITPVMEERSRRTVQLADVFVRCLGGATNPVDVIKAGVIERPDHARFRAAFVESSLRFRSATRGLVGLSSSRVELHRHQVEVVSRVLRDPTQRYLLADEVGLGKTIEAGSILRQFLLDNPDAEVEFLLPPLLLEQWRTELAEKFWSDNKNLTLSKQGEEWTAKRGSDFLIVDEAHHLAAHAFSDNKDLKAQYLRLAEACIKVDRLLLLSATPLLHNEEAFLGLLHLLDPLLYPLDELEAFKTRVESRRELAKRFFAFQSASLDFVLETHSEAFRKLFPNDEQLGAYLSELGEILDSGDDSNRREELIRLVRVHVSETYKLHRRVLRTRRNSPLAAEFPVRGREDPTVLHDKSEMGVRLEHWLTEWLDLMAIRKTDGHFDPSAEAALVAMLDRWQSAPIVLVRCIRAILDSAQIGEASLSPSESEGVRAFDPTEAEQSHLGDLVDLLQERSHSEDWLVSVAQKVLKAPKGTVVFCGDSETAELVADRIEELTSRFDSARYIDASATDRDVEKEVDRFKRGRAHYLICDRSAEEGRNFQYASAAFHVDLPWNPNRIEQRIGRIDRFSSGESVKSLVNVRPDSVAEHWLRLLREGYGVFSDSIATLQHVLATSVTKAVDTLVEYGPDGLDALAPSLREALDQERDDILELEHLESIEDESRLTQGVFDELSGVEDDRTSLEKAVSRWMSSTKHLPGGIGLEVHSRPDNSSFKQFSYPQRGEPSMPREVVDSHLKDFLQTDEWVTFDRQAACDEADGILMRPGAPFFDAVCALTDADDLGQTYGFWRRSGLVKEPLLVVRFAFRTVGTGEGSRQEFLNQGFESKQLDAVMRTMDDFFPPKTIEVNMDHLGEPLSDEVEELIALPYHKTDRPLRPGDVKPLVEHFELDWASWWQGSAEAATDQARQHAMLDRAKSDGQERAERTFTEAILQIQLRLDAETDTRHRDDLEREVERLESFREGVVTVIQSVEPVVEVVGLVLVASASIDFLGN